MNHDPLCNWEWFYHPGGRTVSRCTCDLIARVRADEQKKARAHSTATSSQDGPCCQCCYDVPRVAETIAQALETELQTSHWYKWVDDDGDEDPYGSIVIHGDDQIRSDAAAIARRIGHG